jgi:hypothetical protein
MLSPDACARRVRSSDGKLTGAGDLAPPETGSAETGPIQPMAAIVLQSIVAARRKSGRETVAVATNNPARDTASARVLTPSFKKMRLTCDFTVSGEISGSSDMLVGEALANHREDIALPCR